MNQPSTLSTSTTAATTLAAHRADFARRRLVAMPIAGALAWAAVALVALLMPDPYARVWALYIATGSIFVLGIGVARLTGEDLLGRSRPANPFDNLFLCTVGAALTGYAIALPAATVDYTLLPLGVGVLTGAMWLPLTWVIQHPVGLFHTAARTLGLVALQYAFPDDRFVALPLWIVAVYIVSIIWLEARWRRLGGQTRMN